MIPPLWQLALVCLLLLGPLLAQPSKVLLNTDPQGAIITDQYGNKIGTTGTPIQLDLGPYGTSLEVTLALPGYEPKLERIKCRQLRESGAYPTEGGAIALRSTSALVSLKTFFREHPWLVAMTGLAGAMVGALAMARHVKTRRRLERARTLEEVQARAHEMEDNLLGTKLGPYRLLDLLGQGGTARVYRAVPDLSLDPAQAVAIKVLQPPSEHDPEFRQRFQREVTIWKDLHHPNVAAFIDWDEQDGLTYLVTELLRGETLRSEFQQGARPPAEALALLEPVFRALTFAHQKGVVHRDLKPENILVSPTGRLKVTDFGLARMGPEDKVTKTGTWVGTPEYMAPEQVRGQAIDPRTDQYALGIMLYELLTGAPPFRGEDQVAIIFKQVSSAVPPLPEQLPEQLRRAVVRMLAKRPQDRFDDLDQAFAALESAGG